MLFPTPLLRGTLLRRYKRFLSDVVLDTGETVVAHCANSGAMTGLDTAGAEVWLSPVAGPGRKLAFSWEMIRAEGALVGVNAGHPNRIVAEAVAAGLIPELAGYDTLRREVGYGRNSRIDLLLESAGKPRCYVEIKNVHLRRGRAAAFPDAVTARGAKHLRELSDMVAAGYRAVMVYLVQRSDCDHFTLAEDIDAAYAAAFRKAVADGVETICYSCRLSLDGIALDRPVPILLGSSKE